jgi:hypothetical protein
MCAALDETIVVYDADSTRHFTKARRHSAKRLRAARPVKADTRVIERESGGSFAAIGAVGGVDGISYSQEARSTRTRREAAKSRSHVREWFTELARRWASKASPSLELTRLW